MQRDIDREGRRIDRLTGRTRHSNEYKRPSPTQPRTLPRRQLLNGCSCRTQRVCREHANCPTHSAIERSCGEQMSVSRPASKARKRGSLRGLASVRLEFYFCSKLGPFPAESSPPPVSSTFLCPLLSLPRLFPAAPRCYLSNDVLVFQLILHLLSAGPFSASNGPSVVIHAGDVSS